MVQVLPAVPTFGSRLAQTLEQGVSNIAEGYKQRLENRKAQTAFSVLQDPARSPMEKVTAFMTLPENIKKSSAPIWASILGPQAQIQAQEDQFNRFKQANFGDMGMPQQSPMNQPQGEFGPNDQNNFQMQPEGQPQENRINPNNIQTWPDQLLRQLSAMEGAPGKFAQSELNRRETEKKEKTAREKDIFTKNEPELIKLEDELKDLEIEGARLGRLKTLYSDPSKFPNATLASIFSKEGQITPIAASLLSPEAQEAIKITIDSLNGAQATFGGKVSNFEAATYLKRNATLFNTHEGRMGILDDLSKLNEMNKNYAEGVLDIIDQKGGSDKISFSSAARLWKKKNKDKIEDLKDRFINPDKDVFKALPDASKYQGRKIKNETTGEVFISDGKEWKPFQG